GDHRGDAFEYFKTLLPDPDFGTPVDTFVLYDLPSPIVADDIQRWRSVDVNGDGRPDWVFTGFNNPGLTVLTLIAQPDGTWSKSRQDIPSSTDGGTHPPDLARVDAVSNWFLADIGGAPDNRPDGKADIVIVDETTQQIVSLLSN